MHPGGWNWKKKAQCLLIDFDFYDTDFQERRGLFSSKWRCLGQDSLMVFDRAG